MAYQVLARKWRPQKFEDVLGQQAVTRTLKNALKSKRIAQAFVLSGPRGCGKTTTARILARALSCAQGPTPDPCGVCDACIEIAEGRDIDVLEIDAATHTGVDNVREVIVEGLSIALSAHDPKGVLERGYAIVDDGDGNVITTAAQAREAADVRLQFADDSVAAKIKASDD